MNGGATWRDQRLIVLWRDDHDFWKVLSHELVHLFAADDDEARVEATALQIMAAVESSTRADFERRMEQQVALTAANAARVSRTAPGPTPLADYSRGALELLPHSERMWAHVPFRQRADGAPSEEYVASV